MLNTNDACLKERFPTDILNQRKLSNKRQAMNRNHVLNSPNDITDELIHQIINNDLDSLTINYEFTQKLCRNWTEDDWNNWNKEQFRINPFWKAKRITPLKRIEFEIKLGENVHSLASAFENFKKLEYVNIQDTSGVTDMKQMFHRAISFNQPIGNWDTSNVTDMLKMFYLAKKFNHPIGNWNMSSVEDKQAMFKRAFSYKHTRPKKSK